MDCSLPDYSNNKIFQTILEWVAVSFSVGSSGPMDWTCVSWIGRQILYHWATCCQYYCLKQSLIFRSMKNTKYKRCVLPSIFLFQCSSFWIFSTNISLTINFLVMNSLRFVLKDTICWYRILDWCLPQLLLTS